MGLSPPDTIIDAEGRGVPRPSPHLGARRQGPHADALPKFQAITDDLRDGQPSA